MLEKAVRLTVEARKFLDHVRADIAVFFLDPLGGLQGGVGLASVSEEGLHEVGDVAAGDGDGFDGGADDVAFCHGDDVRDAVAGVDYYAGEGAVGDFGGGPGGGEGEDGLHGDVEAGTVEGFEHNLCGVFAVFGWV